MDGTPTDGVNPWIDSLVSGGAWNDTPSLPSTGGPTTISYNYVQNQYMYGDDHKIYLAGPWSNNEVTAAENALNAWEAVANIDFVQVSSSVDTDIKLWTAPSAAIGGALGNSGFPALSNNTHVNIFFNNQDSSWASWGLGRGTYGYVTLLHELGHALGLAHPHDGGPAPDATLFPGVTAAFGDYGDYNFNQGIYSIMSYNDGWATQYPNHNSLYFGWSATPMAFDIAAIQMIYGANTTYRTGNDTYLLPNGAPWDTFWTCIWDAGGVDEITNAGHGNRCLIDLRAATLTAGEGGGGFVSYGPGVVGGFTIAHGVVIENATGGYGADTLIGNEANNVLTGNDGGDSMLGGNGADTLDGGLGNDFINGGNGADIASYADAGGAVTVNLGTGRATGAAGADTLAGVEGVLGGAGSDSILGDTLANALSGAAGADTLDGGTGADSLSGGLGNDLVFDGDGADRYDGGAGSDTISFAGEGENYTIEYTSTGTRSDYSLSVSVRATSVGAGGPSDIVQNVELLRFSNATVEVDAAGQYDWSGIANYYDAQSRVDWQRVTYDAGNYVLKDFDAANQQNWSEQHSYFDAQARLDWQWVMNDAGDYVYKDFDAANQQNWSEQHSYYDAQARLDWQYIMNDAGDYVYKDLDGANQESWSEKHSYLDAQARLDWQYVMNDAGDYVYKDLDGANQESWSEKHS
ncbi:MAG: M10 family metallopeptidase C-terminal domain-containing protein, partial [Roseomonas sp.]|nr:M10 family metallopeptidase C-terminal domain-containing protein [Roseomonas sp.]